jgi:hypothetical protein
MKAVTSPMYFLNRGASGVFDSFPRHEFENQLAVESVSVSSVLD